MYIICILVSTVDHESISMYMQGIHKATIMYVRMYKLCEVHI